MSSGQEVDTDPLRAALDSAFTQPISLPTTSPTSSISIPPPVPAPTTLSPPATQNDASASVSEDTWKQQYEAYVAEWRATSAISREKAEETRTRFESIRSEEEAEAAKEATAGGDKGKGKDAAASGWEDVHPGRRPLPTGTGSASPSPADARDLVSGEREGHIHFGHGNNNNQAHGSSPPASLSQWEDVPSMTSSFPSLVPSQETSPPSRHRQHPSAHTDSHAPSSTGPESSLQEKDGGGTRGPKESKETIHDPPHQSRGGAASASSKPKPLAVTPVIFNQTLSLKTRTLALLSSLAINMFLPFVNGVMLGFGEIFARNVVAPWFGWKIVNPNGPRTLHPKIVSEAERLASHRRERLTKADEL